jgi:hypothetical protein
MAGRTVPASFPTARFWSAAAHGDRATLGDDHAGGLYRDAAQLQERRRIR